MNFFNTIIIPICNVTIKYDHRSIIIIPEGNITCSVYQNIKMSVPRYVVKTVFSPATSEKLFARKLSVTNICF